MKEKPRVQQAALSLGFPLSLKSRPEVYNPKGRAGIGDPGASDSAGRKPPDFRESKKKKVEGLLVHC